ncbi:hypothetical protein N7468_004955 [Penicillium chermesinum]|uniref:Uncharacterized protein n=1 Tax=Penicillium chermesinum TaxID=63820 RepID=A0A9W9TP81_9EURO|nr:uncharacterized protein N7468_004955 [Penicillium chermesinum]KAJ5231999.1 hypothetical protein N7468_004955 [Penicillium chermesinum]
MSTQSPHPPTPKGPRNNNNNRRPQKKTSTPIAQKTAMLSTPPSSPPRNMSPAGGVTDSSHNIQSKKKPPRSGKKPKDANRASPANPGHRHTSSNPNLMTPQVKDNAAYAGPTFHASPAPSALPIPSFFSRSVPESDPPPNLETDSDNAETEPEIETTPSKPRARPPPIVDQKPTPLDFLFKAAIQARQPNALDSPEATGRMRSPQTEPRPMASNPPGGVFPFEMEPSEHSRASQIGPSFAPSYQDRMKALRSSSSPADAPESEEQRRIKTEQLKHLLLNPPPQKPPSSVSPPHQQPPLFGATNTNGNVPHYATPLRPTSGPPLNCHRPSPRGQLHQCSNSARPQIQFNGFQYGRHPESPLSREVPPYHYVPGAPSPYSHSMANVPVSTPALGNGYTSPPPQYMNATYNMVHPPSPPKPTDTKQMEDDLRRILKISAGPGIQSPFAA